MRFKYLAFALAISICVISNPPSVKADVYGDIAAFFNSLGGSGSTNAPFNAYMSWQAVIKCEVRGDVTTLYYEKQATETCPNAVGTTIQLMCGYGSRDAVSRCIPADLCASYGGYYDGAVCRGPYPNADIYLNDQLVTLNDQCLTITPPWEGCPANWRDIDYNQNPIKPHYSGIVTISPKCNNNQGEKPCANAAWSAANCSWDTSLCSAPKPPVKFSLGLEDLDKLVKNAFFDLVSYIESLFSGKLQIFGGAPMSIVGPGQVYEHTFSLDTSGVAWNSCGIEQNYKSGKCDYLFVCHMIVPDGCQDPSCAASYNCTQISALSNPEVVHASFTPASSDTGKSFAYMAMIVKADMNYDWAEAKGCKDNWCLNASKIVESTKQADLIQVPSPGRPSRSSSPGKGTPTSAGARPTTRVRRSPPSSEPARRWRRASP